MSVATDALQGKGTLVATAVGVGIIGLLVIINKRLKAILTQVAQTKLLNHPDFDHREGEFVAPEE